MLAARGSDEAADHACGPGCDALFRPAARAGARSGMGIGAQPEASPRAEAEAFPITRVFGIDVSPPAGPFDGRIWVATAAAADPRGPAAALAEMAVPPFST